MTSSSAKVEGWPLTPDEFSSGHLVQAGAVLGVLSFYTVDLAISGWGLRPSVISALGRKAPTSTRVMFVFAWLMLASMWVNWLDPFRFGWPVAMDPRISHSGEALAIAFSWVCAIAVSHNFMDTRFRSLQVDEPAWFAPSFLVCGVLGCATGIVNVVGHVFYDNTRLWFMIQLSISVALCIVGLFAWTFAALFLLRAVRGSESIRASLSSIQLAEREKAVRRVKVVLYTGAFLLLFVLTLASSEIVIAIEHGLDTPSPQPSPDAVDGKLTLDRNMSTMIMLYYLYVMRSASGRSILSTWKWMCAVRSGTPLSRGSQTTRSPKAAGASRSMSHTNSTVSVPIGGVTSTLSAAERRGAASPRAKRMSAKNDV